MDVQTMEVTPSKKTNPYVIEKGMFGALQKILISPRHCVQVPGVGMVEARKLNLKQFRMSEKFTYYNLQLPNWFTDNMVVSGVTVESLAPIEISRQINNIHIVMQMYTYLKTNYPRLSDREIYETLKTCQVNREGRIVTSIPYYA